MYMNKRYLPVNCFVIKRHERAGIKTISEV